MSLPTPEPNSLPPGVTRGLWEYASAEHIAEDYDEYFAYNRLFEFDEQVLLRHFKKKGLVADLGCGTGRALVPLARQGFSGLAIDLSEHMLRVVRRKADEEDLPIECVRANLVELDSLAEAGCDYAICLFSTLGMVRGRDNRRRILEHACRLLRPGGLFVVHVHNFWYSLFDPGGPGWVFGNLWQAAVKRDIDRGDKCFRYCGVPDMFLHLYTRGELAGELRRAGLRIKEFISLCPARNRALRWPWLLGRLRANGWIVVCERPLDG